MIQRAHGPSEAEASRLEFLLTGITRAVEEGRLQEALRLADCACRFAPGNPTCLLIHARLLIRLGAASEAVERLRGRDEPDAMGARAEALWTQGALDEAAASVEMLLRRFALDSVESLWPMAARLSLAPSKFRGWIGVVGTGLRLAGQVRAGASVAIMYAGRVCHPPISAVDQEGLSSFELDIPAAVSSHIAACSGALPLLGSGFAWPPEFGLSGWVMLQGKVLVGKARLDWAPKLPVPIAITHCGDGRIRLPLPSVAVDSTGSFSVPLEGVALDGSRVEVSAVLPDGRRLPLAGSPVTMRAVSPTPIRSRVSRTGQTEQEPRSKQIVDIVVPVYAGFKETLWCLERVLATTARSETEVVVVNDASPDLELSGALLRLAHDNRITLLTNRSNVGFPVSANRGMNLHAERDVVILNSDTEVSGDWLDRLKFAAYRADEIGTVTPLGEVASIMSYPAGKQPSARLESADIDWIARSVNARQLVELPVGVGFCIYLKRACLTEVGGFDEDNFGKGYGEENDFCLRARGKGWRHVGATDVFVGHSGARSFGRSKEMLVERNGRVLDALHPGYEAMIADFVAADPLLHARRAIDMHRLLKEASHSVLLVTCDLPGGVKRHVDLRQSELLAAGHKALILQPARTTERADRVTLSTQDPGFENLVYNLPAEIPILQSLLSGLNLSHIELHHFVGLPAASLDLVTRLGIRYDVYVHDYSWICPRLTLLGGNDRYCGEPPIDDCETCIRTHGTALEESLTVAALRGRSSRILEGANVVTAPSHDVRSKFARYFPNVHVKVTAWETPVEQRPRPPVPRDGRIRVAVIGAISVQKGHQILLQCARDAAARNLDLDFVVIGYTSDDAPLLETGRVFISGPYAEGEIDSLLEREQCPIAFFPSVAPETWCYALTHAINWGLPIVAFDMGAIAERLRAYGAADLLPLSSKITDINDSLLRLAGRPTPEIQKEPDMSDTLATNDQPVSQELEASAKILTLPVGVFVFSIQGGATAISTEELAVPALQLGLAPMKSAGTVEFLAGAGTLDRWLTRNSDTFIVRISGGSAALLLTSVRLPGSSPLTINVQRIDVERQPVSSELQGGAAATDSARGLLPTQILAHVENFGDIYFNDGWVGFSGQKLRIEAFAILSVGQLGSDSVEYRGVAADGFQTPWLSNQVLCGSRGRGMPLTGFAIRLKPHIAGRFDCTYSGKFGSGATFGPFKDGELCCSNLPGDPLEALELRVSERFATGPQAPGREVQYSDAP